MAEFNPDEYLKNKELEEFDPDLYLSEEPEEPSLLKDFAKAATKTLPAAGSIAGGVIAGGPTLGAAALGGSALGAMAGKAAQTLIEENFFNEPVKTLEEKITELPKEAVYDVAGNLVGGGVVAPLAKKALTPLKYFASGFSGVPEQVIETYAKNMDDVNKIDNVLLEADKIRESASRAIKSFENTQNSSIAKNIAQKANEPVDTTAAIMFLEQKAAAKNPKINADIVSEINQQKEILKNISTFDEQTGKYFAPAKDAAEMKSKLQDLAQYEEIGRKFNRKDYAGYTMTGAARELRREVNKVLPEYAEANLELAKLRRIEGKINKNLITPEKSIAAMTSVGSGTNPVMEKQVTNLGETLGTDLLTPMQNLAAAQKLGNADVLSGFTTGRAAVPFITGGLANAVGGVPLAVGSAAITTPIGIRSSIQLGNTLGKMGINPGRVSSEAVQAAIPAIYPNLFPKQESITEKAERINNERKLIKGK